MIFIRPLLLLLLLAPLLLKFTGLYLAKTSPWVKWVDRKLLPYLLVSSKKGARIQWGQKYLAVLWCALVIAAAGVYHSKFLLKIKNLLAYIRRCVA